MAPARRLETSAAVVLETSAAVVVSEIPEYSGHRYWTKRLKFPPKCVGTFGQHSTRSHFQCYTWELWSHFQCYTWELWCNKDPKRKKAGLRKTRRFGTTTPVLFSSSAVGGLTWKAAKWRHQFKVNSKYEIEN